MAGSDENTTLEKKARGAKSTKLSPSQVSLVRAIVDGDFADHVREVDSTFKGFGTVSGWVDGKVKGILNMPEIRSNADEDPKGFTKSISNMFRNHYNNVLKKSYRLGLSSTGDPSSQALPPVDDGFVKLLLPPLTGRHLYEAENKAALNEQRVAGGVGNYQHVLKVAWDGLDGDARSEWEQRARDEEGNIDQNRMVLRDNFASQLTRICRDPRFGGMAVFMQFSYRQPDGTVKLFSVEGGLPESALFLDDETAKPAYKTFTRAWRQHAESVLPHSKTPSSSPSDTHIAIPRNEDGVPVFPEVDAPDAPVSALAAIVVAYLEEVWSYSRVNSDMEGEPLPWDDVAAHPEKFYDVKAFDFLTFSKDEINNYTHLFPLVDALGKLCSWSSTNPFRFFIPPVASPSPTTFPLDPVPAQPDESPPIQSGTASASSLALPPSAPAPAPGSPALSPPSSPLSQPCLDPPTPLPTSPPSQEATLPNAARSDIPLSDGQSRVRSETPIVLPPPKVPEPPRAKRTRKRKISSTAPQDTPAAAADDKNTLVGTGRASKRAKRTTARDGPDSVENAEPMSSAQADTRAAPAANVTVPKNSIRSSGFIFKKSISCYEIGLAEYTGDIMQPHEFGLKESVKAEEIARRDPAWLADLWPSYCLVRPTDLAV